MTKMMMIKLSKKILNKMFSKQIFSFQQLLNQLLLYHLIHKQYFRINTKNLGMSLTSLNFFGMPGSILVEQYAHVM